MITILLQGGLGNQLFQIYTIMSYSLEHKVLFLLPNSKKDKTSPHDKSALRPTYWNTIFKELEKNVKSIYDPVFLNFKKINETDIDYKMDTIPFLGNENIILFGYFQNPMLFLKRFIDISHKLKIFDLRETVREKYKSFFETSISNNVEFVSIHFRLGDYKYTNYHTILPKTYYINAMLKIIKTLKQTPLKILYFVENRDNDVEYAQNIIQNIKTKFNITAVHVYDTHMKDYEELLLMSCCHHNILANSTFSCWAAYLNKHIGHIVTYPQKNKWFSPHINAKVKVMLPIWNEIDF